jgi:hypothetical protein
MLRDARDMMLNADVMISDADAGDMMPCVCGCQPDTCDVMNNRS